jgi:hypothetical protein
VLLEHQVLQGLKADLAARLKEAMAAGEGDADRGDQDLAVANDQNETHKQQSPADEPSIAVADEAEPAAATEQLAGEGGVETVDPGEEKHEEKHGEEAEEPNGGMEAQHEQIQAEQPAEDHAGNYTDQQQLQQQQQQQVDCGPEEWETVDIPEEWLPCPFVRVSLAYSHAPCSMVTRHDQIHVSLQVRNIPGDATADSLKEAIEACGVIVRSVAFEEEKHDGKQTAVLRFPPLPLPWKLTEEDLTKPIVPPIQAEERVEPAEDTGLKASEPEEGKGAEEPSAAEKEAETATDEVKAEEVKAGEGKAEEKKAEEVKVEVMKAEGQADETATTDSPVAAAGGIGSRPNEVTAMGPTQGEKRQPALTAETRPTMVTPKSSRPVDDGRRDGDAAKTSRYRESTP